MWNYDFRIKLLVIEKDNLCFCYLLEQKENYNKKETKGGVLVIFKNSFKDVLKILEQNNFIVSFSNNYQLVFPSRDNWFYFVNESTTLSQFIKGDIFDVCNKYQTKFDFGSDFFRMKMTNKVLNEMRYYIDKYSDFSNRMQELVKNIGSDLSINAECNSIIISELFFDVWNKIESIFTAEWIGLRDGNLSKPYYKAYWKFMSKSPLNNLMNQISFDFLKDKNFILLSEEKFTQCFNLYNQLKHCWYRSLDLPTFLNLIESFGFFVKLLQLTYLVLFNEEKKLSFKMNT